jgi:hypothetical protein
VANASSRDMEARSRLTETSFTCAMLTMKR